ncbi:MAG TPA: TatD family hydrolase [Anaerolineales bacterium]|jgi:TatD DNase family protein|nr:TatD family hydrolase [Anaerolineales bacterium]
MLTDTHCHLDFNTFDEDRESVIQRAFQAGVTRILIPALDLESSRSAIHLAETYPNVYAAVGFHPTDLDKFSEKNFEDVQQLAGHEKVVAIGEIGIDYYWVKEREARAFQIEVLKRQLHWAASIHKPVVVHMREEEDAWLGQASEDLLNILSEWHRELTAVKNPLAEKPGVLHSFNGNLEAARKAIAINFCLGVTGPVTYKNAEEKRTIIKQLPLTKLLIETDAPFLTPVPHRGKRNEPEFVIYIADKIAELHGTTREQVADRTATNAAHLFGWEADD